MIPNLSAGSIPVHSRVFGFEGLFVKVEVVMNSIEKGTRSTVKFSSIHEAVILLVLSEEFFHFYEDAFLSEGVSFFTVWSLERVVVVAISVDILIKYKLLYGLSYSVPLENSNSKNLQPADNGSN